MKNVMMIAVSLLMGLFVFTACCSTDKKCCEKDAAACSAKTEVVADSVKCCKTDSIKCCAADSVKACKMDSANCAKVCPKECPKQCAKKVVCPKKDSIK